MSKDEYTQNNLITYIGNKRKLLNHIEKEVQNIKQKLKKDLITSFDGFSGSGSVSRLLKYHSSDLIVNDLEEYSYVINHCYLLTPSDEKKQEINRIIDELNNLEYNVEGPICSSYAPKDTYNVQKGERAFYTRENALIIDTIRKKIDTYPKEYFNYLISPLLVKASINTNTSGVFKGFHKKNGVGHFGGKDEVNTESRITKKIILNKPVFSSQKHQCDVFIYKKDINILINELPMVDIAYLDPPYNQHPYGSNYFMLNVIIENKSENISEVSGIPKDWNRSDYNYYKKAIKSMKELINKSIEKTKYIILSYNNEGIIPLDEWDKIFDPYHITKYEYPYDAFKGCKNLKNRENKVIEIMYLISKK